MTRANHQVPENPGKSPAQKPERETVRDQRRAEALRANLKRRKAQLRGRAQQIDGAPNDGSDTVDNER